MPYGHYGVQGDRTIPRMPGKKQKIINPFLPGGTQDDPAEEQQEIPLLTDFLARRQMGRPPWLQQGRQQFMPQSMTDMSWIREMLSRRNQFRPWG